MTKKVEAPKVQERKEFPGYNFSGDSLEGFLDSIRQKLKPIIPLDADGLHISFESEQDYDDSTRCYVEVSWWRPENEKEKMKREAVQQRREQFERAQYEVLKKKFGFI